MLLHFFLQTEVNGVRRGGCRVKKEYCLFLLKRGYDRHVNEDKEVMAEAVSTKYKQPHRNSSDRAHTGTASH